METSRFIEITDQELIETEEQGNQNTKRKAAYDVRHQILACLIQHLFMSFHSKFRMTKQSYGFTSFADVVLKLLTERDPVALTREIFFNTRREISYLRAAM